MDVSATAPRTMNAREANGLWKPRDGSVSLDDADRYIIQSELLRVNCNVTAAARLLGTTRWTLRYRKRKYIPK